MRFRKGRVAARREKDLGPVPKTDGSEKLPGSGGVVDLATGRHDGVGVT